MVERKAAQRAYLKAGLTAVLKVGKRAAKRDLLKVDSTVAVKGWTGAAWTDYQ